jgi:hypothetical protein
MSVGLAIGDAGPGAALPAVGVAAMDATAALSGGSASAASLSDALAVAAVAQLRREVDHNPDPSTRDRSTPRQRRRTRPHGRSRSRHIPRATQGPVPR